MGILLPILIIFIKKSLIHKQKMGNACDCLNMLQPTSSKHQQPPQPPLSTNRRFNRNKQTQQNNYEQTLQDNKKNGLSQSSISQSVRADAKSFRCKQSTALGSNFGDRRTSSIIQSYIDTSSIVIINPRSTINQSKLDTAQYYTLIDKIAFVKKTADRLKITTPAGSSELNCQPQYMMSTLFIAEGIPLETIPEDICNQQLKSFVQTQNSPVKLILKLNCLECKKKIKLTYCKAYATIQKLKCPKCQKVGKWGLLDIQANAPIWGQGRRILDHQAFEPAPSQIRLLGCVMCFKFADLQKIQGCDCYVCKNCQIPGQQVVCPICNPFEG